MKKNNKLKIVLDTNVFIVSLSTHFRYYWVYEELLNSKYDLCLSNEILYEYQQELSHRYGLKSTDAALDFLLLLPNVYFITPYFRWQLIKHDPDDNKFVDCAIAANADYIVSNDGDFKALKKVFFPPVKVLSIEEFGKVLFQER